MELLLENVDYRHRSGFTNSKGSFGRLLMLSSHRAAVDPFDVLDEDVAGPTWGTLCWCRPICDVLAVFIAPVPRESMNKFVFLCAFSAFSLLVVLERALLCPHEASRLFGATRVQRVSSCLTLTTALAEIHPREGRLLCFVQCWLRLEAAIRHVAIHWLLH